MTTTKKKTSKVKSSVDKWESRELGASAEHVRVVNADVENEIDAALELQPVSIRLQKKLISDLKQIAKTEGIGYQPLIRQALTHFVAEKKKSK